MLDIDLKSEDIGSFLLDLYRKALSLHDNKLYEYFLDHAVSITKSKIGFFHFVSSDQKTIMLTSWNQEALKNCNANFDSHYPIEQAGNWADCVRLKSPVIYNNFNRSPNQKGLPEGHVPIKRMLTIPIIEDSKVYAIFGVGNKEDLYVNDDAVQLNLIANELNKIMKQRLAEAELKESREKYHSLFQNMMDGFAYCKMIFDEQNNPVDFTYLNINNQFEKITGLKREQVIGKKVSEAISGTREANPEIFEIYGRVALTGKSEKFELNFKPLKLCLNISVYSPEKGYFAAIFEDITERKKAEDALRESEQRERKLGDLARRRTKELEELQLKLEEKAAEVEEYATRMEEIAEERSLKLKDAERWAVIGQTAGMVGHDIRNPLQSILGDVFLLKTDLQSLPDSEIKKSLQESIQGIEKSVEYVNKIVVDLQDFARPLHPDTKKCNLEKICKNLLFESDVPANIHTSCSISEDVKEIVADENMLKRILQNLIINSVQAMPNGGRLIIQGYQMKGDVVIEVEDTGVGVPDEIKTKLFTPLFTTKSKGQGFGLAVVKRVTESMNGTVTVESQMGKGTTFILRLPKTKAEIL